MNNKRNKMDFYEWICFFFIGIVCFLFIMGFFEAILMMDYTIYAKIPIALVACWVLLLSFRKFLTMYTRVKAKIFATPQHDVKILLTGWGVSVLFFGTIMASLYCLNVYQPQKINCDIQNQLYGWLLFAVVGIGEEIICRGIAFRLLCDRIGMTWALILSAVIFGFAHIFNDGATVWSALAIAVTSGWLLGVAYVYHQSLWAPIGMHWAWNYLEGYVFGCPVSGAFIQHSIIMSRLIGPTWLTGGTFGPEASVIAILIGVAISLYYTLKLKQKRHNQTTA